MMHRPAWELWKLRRPPQVGAFHFIGKEENREIFHQLGSLPFTAFFKTMLIYFLQFISKAEREREQQSECKKEEMS